MGGGKVSGVGAVDVRKATFILTSEVGRAALVRAGVGATGGGSRGTTTEAVVEILKGATRQWASARPALGGRLSNSQVPFV